MRGLPSRYEASVALPCPFSYEAPTGSYSPGALLVELRESLATEHAHNALKGGGFVNLRP